MKVRAKAEGFYGNRRIRKGEVFDFPGDKPGKWMLPVDQQAKTEVEKQPEVKPMALSELSKKQYGKHERR